MSGTACSRVLTGRLLVALSLLLIACDQKVLTGGLEPTPVGAPVIALSTASADFIALAHSIAPMQMIAVSNSGAGTLGGLGIDTVQYLDDSAGWLTASLASTTAPGTLALQAAAGSLPAGTYYARVKLSATGATNSPRSIAVTLRVDPAAVGPIIGLTAVAAAFSAPSGGTVPSQAVQILAASDAELTGLSITDVTYGANASGWLSATLNGTTAPAALTLAPDLAGLALGSYTALVSIAAPNALNSPRTVRVVLTVSAAPQAPSLRLSTVAATFSGTAASPPASQSVSITNGGGGSLDGLSAGPVSYDSGAAGWLATALSSTSAPATLTLTSSTGSLVSGTYSASVPVRAASPGGVQTVSVTLTVISGATPAVLSITPATIGFVTQAGGPAPSAQNVSVTNGGGGTLGPLAVGTAAYSAGASGWLSATLSATGAPATITITPNTVTLASGTYTASIPVNSAGVGNSPRTIAVSLVVNPLGTPPSPPPPPPPPSPPAPSIALSPAALAFSAMAGGAAPATRNAAVNNAGGGLLAGLVVGAIAYGGGASGWVMASLSSATAPATLSIAPILGGLAAGTYTATVPITAAGAANSPQVASVTLVVSPAGGTISFATDIYPTFQANCLSGGCHVPGQQKPYLNTLSVAYTNLVTAATKYVTKGNPNVGLLVGTLQGTSGPQMPPSGTLSTTFISKVKAWIQQGAPNN